MWYTVVANLLPIGTLVTHKARGIISVGMVIGTWGWDSGCEYVDHIGQDPSAQVASLGYILLVDGTGITRRVFYGDLGLGKLVNVMSMKDE